MSGFNIETWMAGIREWRVALLTSLLCMAAITIAVLRPDLIIRPSSTEATAPQSHYQLPVKPETTGEETAPATTTVEVPAPVTAVEPPIPVKAVKAPAPATPSGSTETSPPPIIDVKTPQPELIPPATDQSYYVQLATFRERALAEKMVGHLKKTNMHIQVIRKKGMYAVWAGPWKKRAQADASKQAIYKQTGLKGFITQR